MGHRFKIFNVKKEDNWKWGKKFKYLMCKKGDTKWKWRQI